jgi:muconate cycloisomerase
LARQINVLAKLIVEYWYDRLDQAVPPGRANGRERELRISGIDLVLVRLPMRRPHRWASLTSSLGSYLLVNVKTDAGISGWGEATALAQWGGDHGRYYGETPATVTHVITDLLWPVLSGEYVSPHLVLFERMDRAVRGHPYAKSAVHAAVLDVVAQSAGIPVYDLLGGRRRDRIPIAHSIGLMPLEQAVDEAHAAVAEGIRTIKLKVGEDLNRDIELIRRIGEVIDSNAEIVVDANQGWGPIAVAQRMIARLRGVNLRYLEQPLAGIDAMAQLARRVELPLMVDESMWTPQDMAEVARRRAASLASVYAAKAGGLSRAMQIDAVAYAHGIATNVNGSGETGVGTLANLHLAAAMASLGEACVLPVSGLEGNRTTEVAGAIYTDDLLAEPLDLRDGSVQVPSGPGWGIAVDETKIERYMVHRDSIGV